MKFTVAFNHAAKFLPDLGVDLYMTDHPTDATAMLAHWDDPDNTLSFRDITDRNEPGMLARLSDELTELAEIQITWSATAKKRLSYYTNAFGPKGGLLIYTTSGKVYLSDTTREHWLLLGEFTREQLDTGRFFLPVKETIMTTETNTNTDTTSLHEEDKEKLRHELNELVGDTVIEFVHRNDVRALLKQLPVVTDITLIDVVLITRLLRECITETIRNAWVEPLVQMAEVSTISEEGKKDLQQQIRAAIDEIFDLDLVEDVLTKENNRDAEIKAKVEEATATGEAIANEVEVEAQLAAESAARQVRNKAALRDIARGTSIGDKPFYLSAAIAVAGIFGGLFD